MNFFSTFKAFSEHFIIAHIAPTKPLVTEKRNKPDHWKFDLVVILLLHSFFLLETTEAHEADNVVRAVARQKDRIRITGAMKKATLAADSGKYCFIHRIFISIYDPPDLLMKKFFKKRKCSRNKHSYCNYQYLLPFF